MKEKLLVESFFSYLVTQKSFPKHLISVEKRLSRLSGSVSNDVLSRCDMIAYCKVNGEIKPLVLFEMKLFRGSLKQGLIQAVSYRSLMFIPFLCVVAQDLVFTSNTIVSTNNLKPNFRLYNLDWYSDIDDFRNLQIMYESFIRSRC